VLEHTKPLLAKHDLARTALLHGPLEYTVGSFLQTASIPNVSGIAGPTYLLVVSKNGEIDKLDFDLAARQVAFYADVVTFFDRVSDPAALRGQDPTLGKPTQNTPAAHPNPSHPVISGPADQLVVATGRGDRLAIRFYGSRQHNRAVRVSVQALDKPLAGVTVELRRGSSVYARSRPFSATGKLVRIVLKRHTSRTFTAGTYTLVVLERAKPLGRGSVHVTIR
jgi:hypothetical protein